MTRGPEPTLIHRVIARLNVGGPSMHVVNLAASMDAGPWRSRLVTGAVPDTEGDMEYYAEDRGVTVVRVADMSREVSLASDLRALWALVRLFRRERPSVVHTHTAKAGTLGRLAALLAGVPVRIHTFHGHVLGGEYFSPLRTRVFLEIERQLARATNRLVVLTRRQAVEMADGLRVAPRDRFTVVPLGLDMARFRAVDPQAARPAARAALGLTDDQRVVGIVGRLVPIKNHELFLDAFARLRAREGEGLRAVVVGGGEREAALRRYAADQGLEGAVLWLGWRRDLPSLYPAFDLVALTSHDEGTPVALLEALAAGIRVVARDVGGVAEVLSDAGAGTVVPASADPDAWAVALAAALDGPAPSPGERDRVVARYSVERLTADLDALYRRELARA
ncbi:MAG: glycosyltransferase [Longimicrobiales bacterium]